MQKGPPGNSEIKAQTHQRFCSCRPIAEITLISEIDIGASGNRPPDVISVRCGKKGICVAARTIVCIRENLTGSAGYIISYLPVILSYPGKSH